MSTIHITLFAEAARNGAATAAKLPHLGVLKVTPNAVTAQATSVGAIGQEVGTIAIHASEQVHMQIGTGGSVTDADTDDTPIEANVTRFFDLGYHDGTLRLSFIDAA